MRAEASPVQLDPSLAGAIHNLQARLGSIRIALTAVIGLDLDPDTRALMLTTASEESVRASAELAAIGALATCVMNPVEAAPCDAAAALRDAADAARIAGLDVALATTTSLPAHASDAALRYALP